MPACPIARGRCSVCGGTTKRAVHPRNPNLYAAVHSYPWDDRDADHAPVVIEEGPPA